MNADRERAEEVFCAALELKEGGEREAYVERACAGDSVLRGAVLDLLSKQADVERFFGDGSTARGIATAAVESLPAQRDLIKAEPVDGFKDEELGKTVGPYKLLQKIGEGGCGVVYMAEQVAPVRRRVALKIIKLGMDTKQVIARFEAERQALALMDHPNIARVLDAGATETGRPYFVMELVRGLKITAYCDEKRLDTRQRSRGLPEHHAAGSPHRLERDSRQ